jgi:hypothetical protein
VVSEDLFHAAATPQLAVFPGHSFLASRGSEMVQDGYIPSATRTVFCLVVDLLKMIYGWIQLTIVKYWNWSMADITTLLE